MARRGRFGTGGQGGSVAGSVIKNILQMQGTGTEEAPAPGVTAPTNPVRKNKLFDEPYTEAQIAANPVFSALKRGITPEEAIKNYRALLKVSNLAPIAGDGKISAKQSRQYQRALASLTPEQRNAERILTTMGISIDTPNGGSIGGYNTADREQILRNLGIDPSTMPKYAPVQQLGTMKNQSLANPLSSRQKSRLQRLRGMAPSSLNSKQKAALARLRGKKNAPTILP